VREKTGTDIQASNFRLEIAFQLYLLKWEGPSYIIQYSCVPNRELHIYWKQELISKESVLRCVLAKCACQSVTTRMC
jgi:hypothetical protein